MTLKAGVAGAKAQRDKDLVVEHLSLVDQVVNQVLGRLPRFVRRDELVSAGHVALVQAAASFDDTRGSFECYATARIRGALLDDMRNRDWASRSVRSRGRRLVGAVETLTADLGRTPTAEEVAGHLGVTSEHVATTANDLERARVLSYDGLITDDPDIMIPAEDANPETVLLERERRAYLADGVAALPDRLRTVVVGYFLEERTSEDLAEALGVSTSRISQMRTQALVMLREGIQAQLEPARPAATAPTTLVSRRRAAYAAAVAAGSSFRERVSVMSARPGLA